jgi:hypothetical protein
MVAPRLVEGEHLVEGIPMPIRWGVNHAARIVSVTGTGVLTKTDIDGYLDDLAAAATLSYGKIFHMDGCSLQLSKDDLAAIGARIRSHEVHGPMGRVAVAAGSDELYEQAAEFNANVLADRPMRIFRDVASAVAWLTDAPIERAGVPKSHSMARRAHKH